MYFDEAPKNNRSDLFGFDEQLHTLVRLLRDGTRLTRIEGLRRTGKTSLLLTALNETGFPHMVIDGREFAQEPAISRADFIQATERALNDFLTREKGLARRLLDLLKTVRGVEVSLDPPEVALVWGPPEIADLVGILKSLGKLGESRKRNIVVALDEAQEFKKLAGYDLTKLLAHVYDYVRGVQLVVTGSQVGFLHDFLKTDDPKSPLFGRVIGAVKTPYLTRDEARIFLKLGFKQIRIRPRKELIEKTLTELNGIVGWLAYVGAEAKKHDKFDESVLERALESGARLAAEELGNFLASRPLARRRYVTILRGAAKTGGARWSDLKRGLEVSERKTVADNVFSGLLENLVKANFLDKEEDKYFIPDPLLIRALGDALIRR